MPFLSEGRFRTPYVRKFANLAHEWDFSFNLTVGESGGALSTTEGVIGGVQAVKAGSGTIGWPFGTQAGRNVAGHANDGSTTYRLDASIGSLSQPFGIQFVGQTSSNGVFFDTASGSVCSFYDFSGTLYMDSSLGGSSACTVANDGKWHVYYCDFNGSSSRLFRDGSLIASGNVGSNGLTTGIRMFNNRIPNNNSTKSIGQLRVCIGTEHAASILAQQRALMRKWRIT